MLPCKIWDVSSTYIAIIPEDRDSRGSSIRDFICPLPVWFSACVSYGPWLCPYIFLSLFFLFHCKTLAAQIYLWIIPKGWHCPTLTLLGFFPAFHFHSLSGECWYRCLHLSFTHVSIFSVCAHEKKQGCLLSKPFGWLILIVGDFSHLLKARSPDAAVLQFSVSFSTDAVVTVPHLWRSSTA